MNEFPRAPQDDEEREACSRGREACSRGRETIAICASQPGPWDYCTRSRGHDGDHVAGTCAWEDKPRRVFARWPQEAT